MCLCRFSVRGQLTTFHLFIQEAPSLLGNKYGRRKMSLISKISCLWGRTRRSFTWKSNMFHLFPPPLTDWKKVVSGSAQSFVSFCDIFFLNYYIFFQNVHKGEGFVKTSSNLPQFHTPRNTRHYVSPVQLLNLQSLHSSVLLSEWLNVYTGCKKKSKIRVF